MAEVSGDQAEHDVDKTPKKKPPIRLIVIALIVILAIIAGIYWFLTRFDVETDDAFVAGRSVSIAPHVGGYVTQLLVNDNQFVHEGQVLARIDPRDWQTALDKANGTLQQDQAQFDGYKMLVAVAEKSFPGQLMQAQGALASAQAQEFRAETDYKRQHSVDRAATSQQDIDYARAALDAAKAQVLQAEAQVQIATPVAPNIGNTKSRVTQLSGQIAAAQADVARAQLDVGWTVIRAPHDGWIAQRNVEQGAYVAAGQTLFTIVEPDVWVTANYKETQIGKMRPGQAVDISVDAYPLLKLHGHVDSLQLGTGASFSTFPPENATGNFVKIVQRVPVKILIDSGLDKGLPLAIGLSVIPVVHTDTTPASPPPIAPAASPDVNVSGSARRE